MESLVGENSLNIKRRTTTIEALHSRVITSLHISGPDERIKRVLNRILSLGDIEVSRLLEEVMNSFSDRHRGFNEALGKHFDFVKHHIPEGAVISEERKLLIGAYFTSEYSFEAAALFNPSMVKHPNQSHVQEGCVRFVMSLRATGEGHISSLEFRSGIVDQNGEVFLDPLSNYAEKPVVRTDKVHDTGLFRLKIKEMGALTPAAGRLLEELGEQFNVEDVYHQAGILRENPESELLYPHKDLNEAIDTVVWLVRSNYGMQFDPKHRISERVIFPVSENESRGIEDARFVMFTDDDGEVTYYATYTAYNGFMILPQLIETKDFIDFNIFTLNGDSVQNKGMALFPRKINGKYAMLSRIDGENNYIMYSDTLHFWQKATLIQEPAKPWEFIQVGNCGSPIETEEGWLLLTHGVGPMRQYGIGMELLDLEDPSKIIGRIEGPIITPDAHDREGYVPNVVYTCGMMLHNNELIIPYAVADQKCVVGTVSVADVLKKIKAV